MPTRLTTRARADIDDIARFITQEQAVAIAARLVQRLNRTFSMLSDHPYAGRSRHDDLGHGRRSVAVAGYIIVYRVVGPDAVILRVIDGRRNYPPILRS